MIEFLYSDSAFISRCYSLTRNKQDAEDLLQDIALKLLNSEAILKRPEHEIKAYAYTMIRNRFIDNIRFNKTNSVELIKDLPSFTEPVVERQMQARFNLNLVSVKLKGLQEADKKALLMVSEGKKYKEVSKELKIPIGTLLANVREARLFIKGERHEPRKWRNNCSIKSNEWKPIEEEIIRSFSYMDAKKISELLLDRTASAIFIRARKLGITLRDDNWSDVEKKILIDNYAKINATQIKKLLPNRTVKAIRHEVRILGLKKNKYVEWSAEEKRDLNIVYRTTSAKELEKRFGRNIKAIQAMYVRLNKNNPIFAFTKRKKLK